MKEILVSEPVFTTAFACVGSECRDHCCKNWTITLDKKHLNKYVSSKQVDIRVIAQQSIEITKTSYANWGYIKLDPETKHCPFLDSQSLCNIYKSLGAQALSETCATFPRVERQFKKEIQRSLNLSCPEVARILLSDPNAMAMQESTLLQDTYNQGAEVNLFSKLVGLICQHLLMVETETIEENLYAMVKFLLFCEKVDVKEENYPVRLEAVFVDLIEQLQTKKIKAEVSALSANAELPCSLLLLIQDYFKTANISRGYTVLNGYLNALRRVMLVSHADLSVDDSMARLHQQWKSHVLPQLTEKKHILRNFLQYKLWQCGFPQNNGKSALPNLYLILCEYYFIKMLIASHSLDTGGFSDDDVINILYSFHALTQHNDAVRQRFNEYIEKINLGDDISMIHLLTA